MIVPVAAGESYWPALLHDLSEQLPVGTQVLLAGVEREPDAFQDTVRAFRFDAKWLQTRPGRAAQMNDAARIADAERLWFLHSDSRLPQAACAALIAATTEQPDALHYFSLQFVDGPRMLRLNEFGVMLRCRLFGLPFGDQGFCLGRELFWRLGGFDERSAYGEDHLFVWAARRRGIRLHPVASVVKTSGRKYAERGWMRTTLRHLWLTFRQAVPEVIRLKWRRTA
ncbi:MAG: glycosyl transferase family 2 [Planctomycetota bacterium]|nr:glycosyl transferase family 2 [Planctomycetaceae bacterium]MDQ3331817.1 glycosyl transferase family 2 [Planctomycetota bacterium]